MAQAALVTFEMGHNGVPSVLFCRGGSTSELMTGPVEVKFLMLLLTFGRIGDHDWIGLLPGEYGY
ncbi:hypothetical protein J6590_104833 [Homalodisca vitripennis]|nr:hypothetical protein J6590_104833 [Homalodisca vitripennis]